MTTPTTMTTSMITTATTMMTNVVVAISLEGLLVGCMQLTAVADSGGGGGGKGGANAPPFGGK